MLYFLTLIFVILFTFVVIPVAVSQFIYWAVVLLLVMVRAFLSLIIRVHALFVLPASTTPNLPKP